MGAFPNLVAHHQDLVFGVARRWSKDRGSAEDLAQETFIRAFRALKGYDTTRITDLHLRGWLARITINLARNAARGRTSDVPTASLDESYERPDPQTPRPDQAAERRESVASWARLLAGLPAGYRAAVGLRHVDGLSYPELAEALGKPIGTVKSDVHRGIAMLRLAYEREQRNEVTAG
ncbi:MAG: sigma-70 family RNA polymerase sigma factor [Candidatus Limnocylindrales bacterium]